MTSFSHHSSAKRSQVDLGHQKLRAEGSSAARWKLLVLHQSRERGWNKRTERSCSHFHQRWQTSRQYLYPFFLRKGHFNFIIRPLSIHFRDKVPAAQRLGSPCSGAVSGSDHPALLLRRAWEHHTCRRRVSFSLLTTFLSPAIFKSDSVSRCPSILGELLLPRGRYYWETIVSRSTAYRLGVAYSTASRSSPLGENRLSWCLQCVPTMSGCVFIHFQTFLYSPQSFWTHFIFLYSLSLSLSQLQVPVAAHQYSVQFVCDWDTWASGHSSRLPARLPVFLQRSKWSAVRHFLPAIYSAMSPCPGPGDAGQPGGQHGPEDARLY